MTRKLLSLVLVIMMMMGIAIPAALAEDNTPDPRSGYYYVKTDNGKGLNVRDAPGGEVVGSLKYGTRIYVDTFTTPEWALTTYTFNKPGYGTQEYAAWVSTRYLVRYDPGKYDGSSSSGSQPAAPATSLSSINSIFASARQVTSPYIVVARPSRASGWVNLRWAPSTDAERITTCSQGKQLVVLVEMKGWLQVQDPATGMVGFISSQYVSRQ